ncbi:MAG: hypothetical protein VR69_16410 [Peptococcaceae bacterium BRH_c4b]|nr:MAG: hypothetical protein VR69_16410 [Peptococcaceae bacterium BRH_c4b]
MNREILAQIVYILILCIMVVSASWVMYDSRKRGRPLGEVLTWGLFTGAFFGLGLVIYLYWRKKMPGHESS